MSNYFHIFMDYCTINLSILMELLLHYPINNNKLYDYNYLLNMDYDTINMEDKFLIMPTTLLQFILNYS